MAVPEVLSRAELLLVSWGHGGVTAKRSTGNCGGGSNRKW
jgi:hypothetical protein